MSNLSKAILILSLALTLAHPALANPISTSISLPNPKVHALPTTALRAGVAAPRGSSSAPRGTAGQTVAEVPPVFAQTPWFALLEALLEALGLGAPAP